MNRPFIKLVVLAVLMLVSPNVCAVQYTSKDSTTVVSLLCKAKKQGVMSTADCQLFFARQLLGIPYVASTLEVNKKETLIVNLRQLDCTTYVENVTALTLCIKNGKTDFKDFCANLQKLRYRDGQNKGYQSRLHYFTDWIENNTKLGICKEIQSPNPPFIARQTIAVNYMTKHSDRYPMLKGDSEMINQIAKTEKNLNGKRYRYIPKKQIKNTQLLRQTINNGDIIAIITNKKGLDTQHIGIAVWHEDGLHLLNASSIHKKVVEEPKLLNDYLAEHPTMPGIRIVRLTDR